MHNVKGLDLVKFNSPIYFFEENAVVPLVALAVMVGTFCLKFYHPNFILQTDVFLNIYLHDNSDLFLKGWDPYVMGYTGWYPIVGRFFPTNALMDWVLRTFFSDSLSATLIALMINAGFLLFMVTLSGYALYRYYGCSRTGAVLGTILVTFTGFQSYSSMRELNIFYLISFISIFWVIQFLDRAIRNGSIRWAIASGIVIGLSLLSGTDTPLFFALPFIPLLFIESVPEDRSQWKKVAGKSLGYWFLALAVGTVISAVIIVPSLSYMKYTMRAASMGSLPFEDIPLREFAGRLFLPFPAGGMINPNLEVFIGIPAVFLMLRALVLDAKKGKWFMLSLVLGAFLLMNVSRMPEWIQLAYRFYAHLGSLRITGCRVLMVGLIGIGFFVARGFDTLRIPFRPKSTDTFLKRVLFKPAIRLGRYSLHGFDLLCLTTAGVYFAIGWKHLCTSVPIELENAAVAVLVVSSVALMVIATIPRISVVLIPLFFALFYFANADIPFYGKSFSGPFQERLDEINEGFKRVFYDPVLSSEKLPYRVFTFVGRQKYWAPRLGVEAAFDPLFDTSSPKYLNEYALKIFSPDDGPHFREGGDASPLLDLYNVKYFGLPSYQGTKLKPTPIGNVYINEDVFPRFYTTHESLTFSSETALFDALPLASREILREKVFLLGRNAALDLKETSPKVVSAPVDEKRGASATNDQVNIVSREPDEINLKVKMDDPGYLVASELWFPAWKVMVDGKTTDLLRAYGTFWAVSLEKGEHNVVFTFFDRMSWMGGLISILGLAGAIGFLCFPWLENSFKKKKTAKSIAPRR